jgi:hypothetical protein
MAGMGFMISTVADKAADAEIIESTETRKPRRSVLF